jgi:hypothetical protein
VFLASHETGIVDEEIRFNLTPEQRRQARRLVTTSLAGFQMWSALVLAFLWGTQLVAIIIWHRPSTNFYMALIFFVCWCGFAVLYATQRTPGLPRDGAFRISTTGINGTLNGKAANIPWRQIAGVRDVGDFVAFMPRRIARPIVVPKASFSDLRATWAFLDDHLVSKRGLIRSSPPPTTIANSAF